MTPNTTKAPRTIVIGPAHVGKTRFARRLCSQGYWFLNLDPARQDHAPLTCAGLLAPGEKPAGFRFLGSLTLWKNPLGAVATALWAAQHAGSEPLVVELPCTSLTHLTVHILRSIIETLNTNHIVTIGLTGTAAQLHATDIEVEERPPLSEAHRWPLHAEIAWRKSAFRDYFANATLHDLSIRDLRLSGARLGSGLPLEPTEMAQLRSLGIPDAEYAEVTSDSLYILTPSKVEPGAVATASAYFACRSAYIANPRLFQGLLVGIENSLGDHFAMGRITATNFSQAALTVLALAESHMPAHKLHFGHLRLSKDCDEIGEIKPWQV